jgi:hypothetical protein
MITVRVTFENGDSLITGINGTLIGAQEYYLGEIFDLGPWHKGENLLKAVKVEEVEG